MQLFIPADGSGAIVGVVGALQLDVLIERLKAEYGLEAGFETTTRFTLCRWDHRRDMPRSRSFARAHGSSMAEDFGRLAGVHGAVGVGTSATRAERWPDIAFADIKDLSEGARVARLDISASSR